MFAAVIPGGPRVERKPQPQHQQRHSQARRTHPEGVGASGLTTIRCISWMHDALDLAIQVDDVHLGQDRSRTADLPVSIVEAQPLCEPRLREVERLHHASGEHAQLRDGEVPARAGCNPIRTTQQRALSSDFCMLARRFVGTKGWGERGREGDRVLLVVVAWLVTYDSGRCQTSDRT